MMANVPTIRGARPEDAPAVSDCIAAAYGHYVARIGKPPAPMLEDYAKVIQRHDVFVLNVSEKIIGVLVLIKQERSILLTNVAVHPDHQGQGFGRKLIAIAEEKARNVGFDAVTLYTNEQMTENIELYKKLGFEETERRLEKGYHRVYMRKTV